MKKSLLSFILFCLLIIAAGCKTAPEDKTPKLTPVETAKASASDVQVVQTENKSETMQNSATAAMPSDSEKVEPKKVEPQKAEAKTSTSTRAPAQKVTPRKTTAQSGSVAKNMPQAKNAQTKPAKQGSAQQKTAKSNASGASAKKTDTPKQSATTTPSKATTKESVQKETPQKAAAAKTDASKQSVKTAPQKAPAKESTQKETPQKAAAQSGSASKNKTASQAKNAQTKPAKQDPKQQETAKSKATAKNNKQSASPEAVKKEAPKPASPEAVKKDAPKTIASTKQGAGDKAVSTKQPQNKKAEAKTKEPAAQTAAAQITDISWMIEQADASFVSKQHKGKGKIFVTMLAKYKGDLTAQDFKEAFFASPADVWGLDEQSAKGLMEINKKEKLLMLKHLSSGEGEGAAALGKWFASVTLEGQKPFEKELNVTGIGGKTVMEDKSTKGAAKGKVLFLIVPAAKAENEQQALTMPVIQSVSRDSDTIEIIFSVNDPRVKNAYFYFDVPGEEYYRDSGSMIDATGKPVNGCRSFSTDGKKCQYVLRKDATNKDWFGKATQCFLVVSDVNRVASPWEERHRTISAASRIAK